MRALTSITCLWPGLAALWLRGRWSGLVTAALFSVVLNFALIATFADSTSPLPPVATPVTAWVLVLGFWVTGVWLGRREFSGRLPERAAADPQLDDWFREAQTQYLKGHWIEAETLLGRLLSQQPEDIEAGLLMAAVQRRTRRLAEARTTLTHLARHDGAARWTWEIHTERARITTTDEQQDQPLADRTDPPLARAA